MFRESDLDTYAAMSADPEVTRYLGATGVLVGRVGLFNPDGWPGLECIWALARGAWGKGYATEGARRALQYAFAELGQARVISLIRPDNTASIRVAERLGETLEGR